MAEALFMGSRSHIARLRLLQHCRYLKKHEMEHEEQAEHGRA